MTRLIGPPALTTVVTNNAASPFSDLFTPSINNTGAVAFLAELRNGGEGIFTGPDAVANKVIAIGDPLFGSAVTALRFGGQGLNDAGQITFWATLADNREVIVRADPLAVPEPSTLRLLGLSSLGLLGWCWARRKSRLSPG